LASELRNRELEEKAAKAADSSARIAELEALDKKSCEDQDVLRRRCDTAVVEAATLTARISQLEGQRLEQATEVESVVAKVRSEWEQRVQASEERIKDLEAQLANQKMAAQVVLSKSETERVQHEERIKHLEAQLASQKMAAQVALSKSEAERVQHQEAIEAIEQQLQEQSKCSQLAIERQLQEQLGDLTIKAAVPEVDLTNQKLRAMLQQAPSVVTKQDEGLRESETGTQAFDVTLFRTGKVADAASEQISPNASTRKDPRTSKSPEKGRTGGSNAILGVSVHHLATALLAEAEAEGLGRDTPIRDVEAAVVRRQEGKSGQAYADLLRGEDQVGHATHVLTCPEDVALGDLAEALCQYCRDAELCPKRTYIWLCCFCLDIDRRTRRGKTRPVALASTAKAEPLEELREETVARLKSVGKVLVFAAPWERPHFMIRSWCVSEIIVALSLGSSACELTVVMPPAETKRLTADLLGGGERILKAWQVFAGIQAEGAKSSSPVEKEYLRKLIKDGAGASTVDATLVRFLQAGLVAAAETQARRLLASSELDGEPAARVCDMLGWLLREVALFPRAAAMLQDGLQLSMRAGSSSEPCERSSLLSSVAGVPRSSIGGHKQQRALEAFNLAREAHKSAGTLRTSEGLAVLSSIGVTKWMSGDRDGAVETLLEARKIREDTETLETSDGAVLLRNIGIAKWACGDQVAGLEAFAAARRIWEQGGGLQGLAGAGLLLNIGFAKADRGDAAGALEAYEGAIKIYESLGGLETPNGATLLSSVGVARGNLGDQEGALGAYARARLIRERTKTLASPAGAVLLRNIGVSLAATGDSAGALGAYDEAMQLREWLGTLHAPAGASLLVSIGDAKAELGDVSSALEVYGRARRVHESVGTLRTTPAGKALLNRLSELGAM